MIPYFGDEKKRKINLGGASVANTSRQAILDRVRAQRTELQEQKSRQDNAARLQAWWRGMKEARAVRKELRNAFETDVTGLTGLRCLVLIGQDEEVLGRWSVSVLQKSEDEFFAPLIGEQGSSWVVLIRQACLLLLRSLSISPQSRYAPSHLNVLTAILSSKTISRVLDAKGITICFDTTRYLINRGLYSLLSQAVRNIPVELKNSPSLPSLIALTVSPLATFSTIPNQYEQALLQFFLHILTIPLLPNRIPLESLPSIASQLPSGLIISRPIIQPIDHLTSIEDKVHLIANLHMFVPPHYNKLKGDTLATYLQLLTKVINSIPVSAFQIPGQRNSGSSVNSSLGWAQEETEYDPDDEHITVVNVVDTFTNHTPTILTKLDNRTLTRLDKLSSPAHIKSLLFATKTHAGSRIDFITLLLAFGSLWPTRRTRIFTSMLVLSEGGLVRELYRGYVRQSPFGRNENFGSLIEPSNGHAWAPLVFLVDLYSQALLTMGDDEFFGSAGNNSAPRNPLSLDELTSFSRQLLNIAFALYWRDDLQEAAVPGLVGYTWENIREKVTRCLVSINARDARRSFVPPHHWLITSHVDMQSFVEAAVFEERELSKGEPVTSRTLSIRQIAMSPRLGILNNIPFAIPFEVRVSIFRHFVMNDALSRGRGRFSKNRVQVRRGMVAQDGFDRLADADLKSPIEITFIDQFGQEEAGIDGGGVFKEFFTSLCKEVFDTDRGLWLANKKNELYPNPHAYATEAHSLNWYRFIGRILGKAMYDGILVDVGFAGFFLAKWLGRQSFLDDLASLDPDLYNGLVFLKHYTGNPEELSLNFTAAIDEFGVTKSVDLCPNGSNIAVTRENRLQYIYYVSHYRLSKQIKLQSDAFFEGLSEIIDPKWLRMFNQQEVQILIGGVNSPIDLDDLRQNTNYGGLYDDNADTIVAFWKVLNSFDQEQRMAFLRFVTSCSRPPLLGFKELVPNFAIRDAGSDQNRLPTSSTCVNLLKLPRYTSERVLRQKLLQAITSGAGFDLS